MSAIAVGGLIFASLASQESSNWVDFPSLYAGSTSWQGYFVSHPGPLPTQQPALSTIIIRARTPAGSKPADAQIWMSPLTAAPNPRRQQPLTRIYPAVPYSAEIVGSNGDWVAANVSSGTWTIRAFSSNYVARTRNSGFDVPEIVGLYVTSGRTYTIDFVFSKGITLTGRILDEWGKPISGDLVDGAVTDAQGRYRIEHAWPPHAPRSPMASMILVVRSPVDPWSLEIRTLAGHSEGDAVALPDIHLPSTGWAYLKVILPPEATEPASPR